MSEHAGAGSSDRPNAGEVPSEQTLLTLERQARTAGPAGEEARRALAALAAGPALPRPVMKELRRVLYRLRSMGIEVEGAEAPRAEGGARALVVQAAASRIGADGSAVVLTVWDLGHTTHVFNARVSDVRGFEEAETRELARRRATAEFEEAVRSGLTAFEPSWGAMMLAGAAARARTRTAGFPRAYVLAREWLEPALAGETSPTPYGWAAGQWSRQLQSALDEDRERLEVWARASSSLAGDPEVEEWDLSEALAPFLAEARQHLETRLSLLPATREAMVERLAFRMSQALHAPPHRSLLGARLAYVALRLERHGRPQEARLAAAASRVLLDRHSPLRVGVLEALSARHLAAYLPPRQRDREAADPRPAAERSPSGLLLPPGTLRPREGG
ncbi:MAG: hypothetical protein AB1609_09265 [Bacillota bacterium]